MTGRGLTPRPSIPPRPRRIARRVRARRRPDLPRASLRDRRLAAALPKRGPGFEGVMINSAGGVVGGDGATYDFELAAGARGDAHHSIGGKNLPQRRRDGAGRHFPARRRRAENSTGFRRKPSCSIRRDCRRKLSVDLAADARLILVESLVFGRLAMGDSIACGFFRDSWRIRRDNKLIFAEDMRIGDAIAATLDRPACGAGARAAATLAMVAPDAESRLEGLRAVLAAHDCASGASAWDGMLVARLASPAPDLLRRAVAAALAHLRGCDLPRVWQ